jgi:aminopeptidase S
LEHAGCPYAAIGAAAGYCGPFFDDLEIGRGWTYDPGGTDTATAGRWSRGIPKASPLQRRDATSGQAVLVTGRPSGADVDGGRTRVRSPRFRLPDSGTATLRLRYWVGLGANAGSNDGLTVRLVDESGDQVGADLLTVTGDGAERVPTWKSLVIRLPGAAMGRRVAVELIARDDPKDGDATVEAGVDGVRVTLD